MQVAVEQAAGKWPPAAIVLVGIAGSLEPDRVKLGDVIVPTQVFGYTEARAEVVDGKESDDLPPDRTPAGPRYVGARPCREPRPCARLADLVAPGWSSG